jgi:hypothetical protein
MPAKQRRLSTAVAAGATAEAVRGSSCARYFSGVRIPYLIRFRTPRKTFAKSSDRDFRARFVDTCGIPARRKPRMAVAGTRALIVSIETNRTIPSRSTMKTAASAIPPFSLELNTPHGRTICRLVSHRIVKGRSSCRRTASELLGASTATPATSAPALRISA